MGDIVNLRKARKNRERAEKESRAQENRRAYGRSKAERMLSEAKSRLESTRLDAHKRELADDGA
jgi:hypothetical protein